ncbi:MAG: DUF413 domain-containing protein, partial [Gammaproteobacteria bacterium]|nr:DUF413 domain-containing protein [Gammaproteobacteria bacterium]
YADFPSSKTYFDNKHYPRGFSRSGDFSIKEAELLSRYGVILNELSLGKVEASNDGQRHFVQVIHGEAEPANLLEKVWMKYLDKTTRPVIRYSCSAASTDGDFGGDDSGGGGGGGGGGDY